MKVSKGKKRLIDEFCRRDLKKDLNFITTVYPAGLLSNKSRITFHTKIIIFY